MLRTQGYLTAGMTILRLEAAHDAEMNVCFDFDFPCLVLSDSALCANVGTEDI